MPVNGSRATTVIVLAISLMAACTSPRPLPTALPLPSQSATDAPPPGTPPAGPTPTGVASPSEGPTPNGTPHAGWVQLAEAPDAGASWSPDAQHLLIWLRTPAGPPESYSVRIMDRSGSLVQAHEAVTDPLWLDEGRFVGYRLDWQQDEAGQWFAETGPNGERLGTALIGEIGSTEPTEAPALSMDPVLSNGRGALALTRFDGAGLPEVAVWSDGALTDWQPGAALAWSNGTDHLALVRPTQSGPSNEGPLEVVAWPSMQSAWSSPPDVSVSVARLDPTGTYLAYPEFIPAPRVPREVPKFDLVVNVVDLGADTVVGVPAPENGTFAWLAHERLIVVGYESMLASVIDLGGQVLAQESVIGPSVVTDVNGQTALFYDGELDEPPMQVLRGEELSLLESPGTLAGPAPALAPDGTGIVVVVRQPGPENPPATVLLHQL